MLGLFGILKLIKIIKDNFFMEKQDKEVVKGILSRKQMVNLFKWPFRKAKWSSQIRIINACKVVLAIGWIIYFSIAVTPIYNVLEPIYDIIHLSVFLKDKLDNAVIGLLVISVIYLLAKFVCYLIITNRILEYKPVHDEYGDDSKEDSYQEKLVKFLNQAPKFGDNIFWITGGWGSGKTFYIRKFFEKQKIKIDEIYYVSCFGIKTREQAENVLSSEIEVHSVFNILDFIPVVGNLCKLFYKIVGLDLIRKNSIIIFDDLERVVYSEGNSDDPSLYNDILGFIDYLANHRNEKVIVLFNDAEISNTYKKIINDKFKPQIHRQSIFDILLLLISEKLENIDTVHLAYLLFSYTFNDLQRPNLRYVSHFLEDDFVNRING